MSTRLIVETLGILIGLDALYITGTFDHVSGTVTLVLGIATFVAGRRIKETK